MKCLEQEITTQRTGSTPGEMQKEPSPGKPHRAQNLQVPNTPGSSGIVPHIKWPPPKQHRLWHQFDGNTFRVINVTAMGDVEG